ncbi:VOC family protein [Rhizobium sp. 18065]|uniref:VOC family protein n=1 Tax=Rhizobium sp. 18065 TaxID=2681411 RepID=UPI001357E83C|nr:VOC family protein [Rhizobium sp. 18065]
METQHQAPRSIDHLVLPVGSLDVARARLSALGFTVAADAIHPFGTENACVFFADETYLEPLAVASREDCEASAKAGNVFVARDQAFRFRKGEGLSAIVVKTDDASADDIRFRTQGFGAGEMLEFARQMRFPDGREINAAFRLAFAADLRGPDFFLFACQRINALPTDRGALLVHGNGVVGISRVVLVEDNPSDFQYLLELGLGQRDVTAHSFGISLLTANASVDALTPEGFSAHFGSTPRRKGRGLEGAAVVFHSRDIGVTEACLAANAIAYQKVGARLIVAPAPGQGVLFVFEEQA